MEASGELTEILREIFHESIHESFTKGNNNITVSFWEDYIVMFVESLR